MNMKKLKDTYGDVRWAGRKRILGMPITFTLYIVTDVKLITRVGLLSLKEDEVELYRIVDKHADFPFGQRIFGCGSLTLTCIDTDTPNKILKSIKAPRKVKEILDSLIMEQRDKYRVRGRDMMGAADDYNEDISMSGADNNL